MPKIVLIEPTKKLTSNELGALTAKERIEVGALIRVYRGDYANLVHAVRLTKKAIEDLEQTFTRAEQKEIVYRVQSITGQGAENSELTEALAGLEEKHSGRLVGMLYREIRLAVGYLEAKRHKASYRDLTSGISALVASIMRLREMAPKDKSDLEDDTWENLRNNYAQSQLKA